MTSFFRSACAALALTIVTAGGALAASAPSAKLLVMEKFFGGRAVAQGTFHSSLFGPDRQVAAKFHGLWNGRVLTLIEDIAYSDGEKDQKIWKLEKTGSGTFIGRRDDLVGDASVFTDEMGRVHLKYTAVTGGRNLTFDDILQLNADGTVLNTTSVSYYFIHVGDVELHFRRVGRRVDTRGRQR